MDLSIPACFCCVHQECSALPDHAVPGPFFRIMFAESNLEGRGDISLQRAGLFLFTRKAVNFPSLVFLGSDANPLSAQHAWAPVLPLGDSGNKGNQHDQAHSLDIAFAIENSDVSDLLATMKQ